MPDRVAALLARIAEIGGRLTVEGDAVRYDGPLGDLSEDLRTEIRVLKRDLLERLRPRTVPELLVELGGHGAWLSVEDGALIVHFYEGADSPPEPPAVASEIDARADEVVAFLRKSEAELTAAELRALGYVPPRPGRCILRDPDEDEGRGWTPPPGWGLAGLRKPSEGASAPRAEHMRVNLGALDPVAKTVPLASIRIESRLREDLGEIDDLAASIRRHGLMQPPLVDADGVLVAGRRRVEACRRLGMTEIEVVAYPVSLSVEDRHAIERAENAHRKDYTERERAEAARRQRRPRSGEDRRLGT